MEAEAEDLNHALMLDGNAVAGALQEMFGSEMTANHAECANCSTVSFVGGLLAFTHAPGLVLRCPSCEAVMLRLVRTPHGTYLDARGSAYMRLAPPAA